MKLPLRNLWLARSPQERKALGAGGALLFLLLYVWLLQAGGAARATLQDSVLSLRSEAAALEQQAVELEQLRSLPSVSTSETGLLPLLQTATANAGLTDLLLRSEALDNDQVSMTFGAIPFATWLRWVDELQAQNIRVASARIEALSTPGLVSVTATLSRPAAP
jgi:type II secretory pathway component PulM